MPLVFIHLQRGRTAEELGAVAAAIHRAVVDGFSVPETDRYQIITQHDPQEMVALDTGLGIERSRDLVVLHVVSRARTIGQKQDFYRLLTDHLNRDCGIAPSDVIVSITENGDGDWSFGLGEAQFLTGALD